MILWISIQYSVDFFLFELTATKDCIEISKEESSENQEDSPLQTSDWTWNF